MTIQSIDNLKRSSEDLIDSYWHKSTKIPYTQIMDLDDVVGPIYVKSSRESSLIDTLLIKNAISEAIDKNKLLVLIDDFEINETLEIPSSLRISSISRSKVSLDVADNIDAMFITSSKLEISNIVINGNNKCQTALWAKNEMPVIRDVEIYNFSDGLMTGKSLNGNGGNTTGALLCENVIIHQCNRGLMIYGNYTNTLATLINCHIYNVVNTTYYGSALRSVSVIGGDFSGDVTKTAQNFYLCENVSIIGGYYHNLLRGVTVGKSTKYFTISNIVSRNIGLYGLSLDTKIDDNTYDEGIGIVSNCVFYECNLAIRVQANNVKILNNHCVNHTASTEAAFIIQYSSPVFFSGNTVSGGNGKLFRANHSTVYLGDNNMTDVSDALAYTSNESNVYSGKTLLFSGMGEKTIPNDADMILCDASEGSYNVRLQPGSYYTMYGKKIKIIKTSVTGGVIIAVSTGTTINGSIRSIKLLNKNDYTELTCNGSDWIITDYNLSQTISSSNSTIFMNIDTNVMIDSIRVIARTNVANLKCDIVTNDENIISPLFDRVNLTNGDIQVINSIGTDILTGNSRRIRFSAAGNTGDGLEIKLYFKLLV